jgi:hypothetical protein
MSRKRRFGLKTISLTLMAAVVLTLGLGLAAAEEKLGVQIYEGAKYDETVSQFVNEAMHVEAYCFRTNDSVAKVTEFYKKQPGFEYTGGDETGGMFKKGEITITIQNPWMDMKTGKTIKDTLISIVKQ